MKRYLALILSVCLALGASACGGSSSDPQQTVAETASSTLSSEKKQAIVDFDTKVSSIVAISEKTTKELLTMMQGLTDGSVTTIDVYSAAESAVYMQNELRSDLTTNDKKAKAYIEICQNYVLNAFGIANDIKQYLDTNDIKYLSSAESCISAAQTYAFDVAAERMAYLSASGLTDDEISQILGVVPDSSEME